MLSSGSERAGGKTFRAKTPAMSVATGDREITAELVYMPSETSEQTGDVFSLGVDLEQADVRGKIVFGAFSSIKRTI